jgi:hypothetical protein
MAYECNTTIEEEDIGFAIHIISPPIRSHTCWHKHGSMSIMVSTFQIGLLDPRSDISIWRIAEVPYTITVPTLNQGILLGCIA